MRPVTMRKDGIQTRQRKTHPPQASLHAMHTGGPAKAPRPEGTERSTAASRKGRSANESRRSQAGARRAAKDYGAGGGDSKKRRIARPTTGGGHDSLGTRPESGAASASPTPADAHLKTEMGVGGRLGDPIPIAVPMAADGGAQVSCDTYPLALQSFPVLVSADQQQQLQHAGANCSDAAGQQQQQMLCAVASSANMWPDSAVTSYSSLMFVGPTTAHQSLAESGGEAAATRCIDVASSSYAIYPTLEQSTSAAISGSGTNYVLAGPVSVEARASQSAASIGQSICPSFLENIA